MTQAPGGDGQASSVEPEWTPAVLVLTDIEGSTRLWAAHPDLMLDILTRHHAVIHQAVAAHGGWRPVDQGEGDAVLAVFSAIKDALAAVARFQTALAAQRWPSGVEVRVRVGVHAGEVVISRGNVFGSAVSRCARVRGLAAGGQVLLSQASVELLGPEPSSGLTLTDLGEHRLKDLSAPDHLYQLDIDGLTRDFPPLPSLDRATHNLPVSATSLVGRERELGELVDLVKRERVVTITGFGGSGKTRLALRVAAELADGTGDGVWFVDVSGETDGSRVAGLVARVLAVSTVGREPLAALVDALPGRRLLVVLDNVEQVLADAAELVETIARVAPDVRFLVTSRAALRIRGEWAFALDPLPFPVVGAAPGRASAGADVDEIAATASVALFVARAVAVRPGFVLTSDNADAVARICARVGGLPLAIELAAAQVRVLSPGRLLGRLDAALDSRAGGIRDLPARQQTMRATIQWSLDLLPPEAAAVLGHLAVFPATFTLAAAEAVCDSQHDPLTAVIDLVDRSLLTFFPAVGDQSEDRYSLLPLVREDVRRRLPAPTAAVTAARHTEWVRRLVTLPLDATRADLARRRAAVKAELSDIRAAVDRSLVAGNVSTAVAVAAGATTEMRQLGLHADCRVLIRSCLDRGPAENGDLVQLMLDDTNVELENGPTDRGRMLASRCLPVARRVGEPSLLVLALYAAARVERSRPLLTELIAEIRALVDLLPERGNRVARWNARRTVDFLVSDVMYVDLDAALAAQRRTVLSTAEADLAVEEGILCDLLVKGNRLSEAVALVERFEREGERDRGHLDLAHAYALVSAAEYRILLGDPIRALADVELIWDDLDTWAVPTLRISTVWVRACALRALNRAEEAERLLVGTHTWSAPDPDGTDEAAAVDAVSSASIDLLLAVLARERGDDAAAARFLGRAWPGLAGRDLHHLDLVLLCLLEMAVQDEQDNPERAALLLGLVGAHRRGYSLVGDPGYDIPSMTARLSGRLGPAVVESLLAEGAARALDRPDDVCASGSAPISGG